MIKLIRIQIDKCWSDHACLIIHRHTFYGHWSIKTCQHHHYNKSVLLNESRHSYNIVLFHQMSMNVYNIRGIDSLTTTRKIIRLSFSSSFFHVIDGKVVWNIFKTQWIWFYFKIYWFEVIDLHTIITQESVTWIVV